MEGTTAMQSSYRDNPDDVKDNDELPAYYDPKTNKITLDLPAQDPFDHDEAEELVLDVRVRKKKPRKRPSFLGTPTTENRYNLYVTVGVILLVASIFGIAIVWDHGNKSGSRYIDTAQESKAANSNVPNNPEPPMGDEATPESTLAPEEAVAVEEVPASVVPTPPPTFAPTSFAPTMAPTLRPLAAQQVENFKNGTALLVSVNVLHHGTFTCCIEMEALRKPSFSCAYPQPPLDNVTADYPMRFPWRQNETSRNIQIVKQYFDFVLWSLHDGLPSNPTLHDTDWEDPNLLSFFVIREPISRSLVEDPVVAAKYPTVYTTHDKDEKNWWEFATDKVINDNYALRILANDPACCNGSNTDRSFLEKAKDMIRRFTFILDIDCLEHSLDKMAGMLGFELLHYGKSEDSLYDHTPVKDKIPYIFIYDYLMEKNKLDIELYEWAKQFALVNCSEVYAAEAAAKLAAGINETGNDPPLNDGSRN